MDMNTQNNYTKLCGTMAGSPVFSHVSRSQEFYTFPLDVQRLSGNFDTLNIIVRRSQLCELQEHDGEKLCVTGQVRTFNNRRGEGAKLVITVLAKELLFCNDDDSNLVILSGTLCKPANLRTTPMGRDICDLMLAVNRSYSRSDYLPCICWGQLAQKACLWEVGTQIQLTGRLQSRRYIKLTDAGAVEKTAFEVSVTEAEAFTTEI